jgi:hypothetical protein
VRERIRWWCWEHEVKFWWQDVRCWALGHRIRVGHGFAFCVRCGWYEALPGEPE